MLSFLDEAIKHALRLTLYDPAGTRMYQAGLAFSFPVLPVWGLPLFFEGMILAFAGVIAPFVQEVLKHS